MNRAAVVAMAVTVGLAPLMSGCVAAAVPLVASAALAKSRLDRKPGAPASEPDSEPDSEPGVTVVPTGLTALPPPTPDTAASPVGTFRDYVLEQAAIEPGSGPRPSALLEGASDLAVHRRDCGALPPAVVIDLDPGRGTFDPLAQGRADPALPAALAALRDKQVVVIWTSRLGENFASAVRAALAAAKLDPAGSDRLELLGAIDERKQTRRDAIAKTLCPVAILGDERADFDELYLYLKQPDAAVALEAMIDHGWFLASPFRSGD